MFPLKTTPTIKCDHERYYEISCWGEMPSQVPLWIEYDIDAETKKIKIRNLNTIFGNLKKCECEKCLPNTTAF